MAYNWYGETLSAASPVDARFYGTSTVERAYQYEEMELQRAREEIRALMQINLKQQQQMTGQRQKFICVQCADPSPHTHFKGLSSYYGDADLNQGTAPVFEGVKRSTDAPFWQSRPSKLSSLDELRSSVDKFTAQALNELREKGLLN